MKAKWKTAACVAGIVGALVVAGAVHHHMGRKHETGGRPDRQTSLADRTGITATGYAEVKTQADQPTTLQVQLSSRASRDELEAKVTEFQAKVETLKASLVKAGIAADAIRVIGFNVNQDYGPKGMDYYPDMPVMPDQATDFRVSATLMVTCDNPAQMVTLFKHAAEQGAFTVDTFGYKGYQRGMFFDTAALEPAVKQATEQAKALAAAQAAAAGVKLGALRSIEVRQPDYYPGPDEAVRVTVDLTYDIAAASK